MKIILLQSGDGADWIWPIVAPEGMDDEKALQIAQESLDRARAENPDDYTQTDVEKLLLAEGFQCPKYKQGPIWD